jgi:hypothetical protein
MRIVCLDGRMLVIGRVLRTAAVAACAALVFAGCSSGEDDAKPAKGDIDAAKMQSSLLQGKDIGATWAAPDASTAPPQLLSICGGTNAAPAIPGSPRVVTAPLVDEGTAGAQSLTQTALIYSDDVSALAGQSALKVVADACPPSVDVDAQTTDDSQEPAYTETVRTQTLNQGQWSGFVVIRHKQYEPSHPSTADTAIAVLVKRNVVFFDGYAVYRLGTKGSPPSANPQFSSDWQKLVGTVLSRVDG